LKVIFFKPDLSKYFMVTLDSNTHNVSILTEKVKSLFLRRLMIMWPRSRDLG